MSRSPGNTLFYLQALTEVWLSLIAQGLALTAPVSSKTFPPIGILPARFGKPNSPAGGKPEKAEEVCALSGL
jgi:hypothetical protein